jgi:hypothetical protein
MIKLKAETGIENAYSIILIDTRRTTTNFNRRTAPLARWKWLYAEHSIV